MTAGLEGCRAAYYLVHSLDSKDFERMDAEAACNFGQAAADGRDRADRLPRWTGRQRRRNCRAPAQPPRGGGTARQRRRSGHGAACRDHHRQGGHLVGDDPTARGPPARRWSRRAGSAQTRNRSRSTTSSATSSEYWMNPRATGPSLRDRRTGGDASTPPCCGGWRRSGTGLFCIVPVPLLSQGSRRSGCPW